uniref:Uncharacterized protein TCIL3000_11_14820 n=1 Tax=Trypanosoma congolense (strain IL3000) TaxID=1068625 RepID=G0V2U3_TRYCI|nr:unnamed protein product [Trypanosoma congolense IL3000]
MDTLCAILFSRHREAAVLACDELGITPNDLLYKGKKSFKQSESDPKSAILVRYTLNERERQRKIRKVLELRNRIVAYGDVPTHWKERRELLPNAPRPPHVPKCLLSKLLARLDEEGKRLGISDKITDENLRSMLRCDGEHAKVGKRCKSVPPSIDCLFDDGDKGQEKLKVFKKKNCSLRTANVMGRMAQLMPAGLLARTRRKPPARTTYPGRDPVKEQSRQRGTPNMHPNYDKDTSRSYSGVMPCPVPDPPPLPKCLWKGRDEQSLPQHAKALRIYRHILSIYAQEVADMLDSLNQTPAAAEAMVEGATTTASARVDKHEKLFSEGSNVTTATAEKNGAMSEVSTNAVRSSYDRRAAVYLRVAQMKMMRNMEEYAKMKEYIDELAEKGECGTISRYVKHRAELCRYPTYEEYKEMMRKKEEDRQQRAREKEKEFQRALKLRMKKEKKARQVLKKLSDRKVNVYWETVSTQLNITSENIRCKERQWKLKQSGYKARRTKRDMEIKERSNRLTHMVHARRLRHNEEQLFRKELEKRLTKMNVKKQWNMEALTAGEQVSSAM